MATTLENGMVVRIPVRLVDVQDRGNIRALVGTRMILLDGTFLAEAAELVAPAPPAPKSSIDALADVIAKLDARLNAVEAAKATPTPGKLAEFGPST